MRVLASVDVEAVARNMDFVTLQDNVMNITFCNIESELARLLFTYFLCAQSVSTTGAALDGKMFPPL